MFTYLTALAERGKIGQLGADHRVSKIKSHQIPWFNHLAEYLQPVGQQSLPASANNFSEYPSNGYHFDAQATRGGTHVCEVSIGVGKRALRSCEVHLRPQAKDLILAISNRHRKNQKPMMTHGLVLYKWYNAIECYWILLGLPKLEYISRTCYWAARSPMLSVETRNLILIILFVERVSEQWNEHVLGSRNRCVSKWGIPKMASSMVINSDKSRIKGENALEFAWNRRL